MTSSASALYRKQPLDQERDVDRSLLLGRMVRRRAIEVLELDVLPEGHGGATKFTEIPSQGDARRRVGASADMGEAKVRKETDQESTTEPAPVLHRSYLPALQEQHRCED